MTPAKNRSEIRTVQGLRAAACLLVVAYHALDAWGATCKPPQNADSLWPNGAAGVDIFFVISGFVMALSSGGLSGVVGARRFVVRRLRRIVPLYWVLTLAKLGLLLMVSGWVLPGMWHVIASFLFIPSRDAAGGVRPVLSVGWTLQFEMLFYGLVACAVARRKAGRSGSVLPWLLPILAALALAGFYRRPDWPAPLALANGLVLEFALGLGVAVWVGTGDTRSPRHAVVLLGLGAVLLLSLPEPGPWRFLFWGVPAACVLAGAVRLEPICGPRLPSWLLAMGEASYAIYLVHPFLVHPLARALAGLTRTQAGLPVLEGASLLASALAGLALHRWVDRPIQARLATRVSGKPLAVSQVPVC